MQVALHSVPQRSLFTNRFCSKPGAEMRDYRGAFTAKSAENAKKRDRRARIPSSFALFALFAVEK
jgi:hypothetical protein